MIGISAQTVIYVDTNILVYYVDGLSSLTPKAIALLDEARELGARLVTSELTVAECIYKWHRERNLARVAVYQDLFRSDFVELYPVTGDLAIRAAQEGGELGLKLIDAIHYMSALEAGCDVFVTADRKFRSTQYLEVVGI
jgi:predicted nucleic acid-binding protein